MISYRKGVVAVLVNENGQVLLCQRSDNSSAWQFPQGGIELNETPQDAFFRELAEELGNNKCEILKTSEKNTFYIWPRAGKDFLGQEQTWFLARFLPDQYPDLNKSDGSFSSCIWESPQNALRLIIEWKRPAFEQGMKMLGIL
jgi:putative (di)nucleoside polyphosphate hydrolase